MWRHTREVFGEHRSATTAQLVQKETGRQLSLERALGLRTHTTRGEQTHVCSRVYDAHLKQKVGCMGTGVTIAPA